jgi:hypothetical protein
MEEMVKELTKLRPQMLQQFAATHQNDTMALLAAKAASEEQKKIMAASQPKQMGTPPKVNEQVVASMAPPQAPQIQVQRMQAPQAEQQAQGLPEDSGIAQLPAPNMKRLAGGGIVAFGGGGDIDGYDKGGTIRNAGSNPFVIALAKEGVQDPRQVAFLKAIYAQESTSGKKSETSNRGAVGGMQILPDTFDSVADEGMDIKDPVDNARAGIRYALQGYQAAGGNPELAGAYYYGGPKGMEKAAKGIARSDPKNPQAPTTLGYGKDIARRMAALMPVGSAQAEEIPTASGVTTDKKPAESKDLDKRGLAALGGGYTLGTLGGMAAGAYEALTPSFAPGTTLRNALFRTTSTAGPASLIGATGGVLSAGAANALSNATPEQLDMLQNSGGGDDTSFAAAIMNPANRGPEVTAKQMPYSQQMANVAKTLVMHPDVMKGNAPVVAPEDQGLGSLTNKGTSGSPDISAGPDIVAETEEKQIAEAPAAPSKNPDEWTKDDWLALAAGMGESSDPYFTKMLGGGLKNLVANRTNRKKFEIDKTLNEAHVAELQGRAGLYPSKEEQLKAKTDALKNAPTGQDKLAFTALQTALRDLSSELAVLERTDPNAMSPATGARKAVLTAQIAEARNRLNQYTQGGQSGTISAAPAITVPSAVTVTKVG